MKDGEPQLADTLFIKPGSLLTVKGAPDILLERCTSIVQADGLLGLLTTADSAAIRKLKDKWSSDGKRVILLARKMVTPMDIVPDVPSPDMEQRLLRETSSGLTFVGLLALVDPPRTDIPDVMKTLRGAGIRTFMVCIHFPPCRKEHGGAAHQCRCGHG